MAGALLTDLYELNMAASYLKRGMDAPATFSLFVRNLPPSRGFLVAAGLGPCLSFLESFSFEEEDLRFLGETLGFDAEALDRFRTVRFDGEVWAVPEGRVVFANEPILEVTAPIAVAQLVETYLLNQITLHTTMTTKAARYRIAAGDRDLVDFAFRRTHGAEAAMAVARSSALAGFVATSNVEAARRLGLRAAGTMAHSYIESFPSEADAFRAFARDFPGRTTFPVDTYDSENGVRTAIEVIRELGLTEGLGVRLDSGDLDALSRRARRILDEAGLHRVRIFASGGLDETTVQRLVEGGAPIDAFGVGEQLGVSIDAPGLESAYKLVVYAGRPVMKLSPGKVSAPGAKQVFRGREGDVIGLRDEAPPAGTKPLLEPVMRDGKRLAPAASIQEARARLEGELRGLPGSAKDLSRPQAPAARFSDRLEQLIAEVRGGLEGAAGSPSSGVQAGSP